MFYFNCLYEDVKNIIKRSKNTDNVGLCDATIKHKHPDSLKFLINILGDYGFFYDVEILNVPVRFKFSYLYQNRISVKVKKKFELFDMTRKEEATLWYFISEEK